MVGRDEDDASTETATEIGEEIDDAASWTTVDSAEVNDLEGQVCSHKAGLNLIILFIMDIHVNTLTLFFAGWQDDTICTGSDDMEQEDTNHTQLNKRTEAIEPDGDSAVNGLGNALSLPFSALIKALKFAVNFLWALRDSRMNSEVTRSSISSSTLNDDAQQDCKTVDEQHKNAFANSSENLAEGLESSAMTTDVLQEVNNPVLLDEDNNVNYEERSDEAKEDDALIYTEPKTEVACEFFKPFDSVKDSDDHNFQKESSQVRSLIIVLQLFLDKHVLFP